MLLDCQKVQRKGINEGRWKVNDVARLSASS